MPRSRAACFACLVAFALACGPSKGDPSSTVTATTTGTTIDATSTTTISTTTIGTTTIGPLPTGSASTADDSASGDPTASDTASMPDLPVPGAPCDPWQDVCPAGQKCKPFGKNDSAWQGASCVPVADPATPVGGACKTGDDAFVDECAEGSVCHAVSTLEEVRRCYPLCGGSVDEPTCADSCSMCMSNGGLAGVCLFSCDPRAFECPEGQQCLIQPDLPRFVCLSTPAQKSAGESCEGDAWCVDGTACVNFSLVPNCDSGQCCTPVCDLDGPDTCPDALPGTTCSPWPITSPDFKLACMPAGLGLCTAS